MAVFQLWMASEGMISSGKTGMLFDGDSKATCVRIYTERDIRDVVLERVTCTWDVLTCVQLNVHIHGFAALSIHDFHHGPGGRTRLL